MAFLFKKKRTAKKEEGVLQRVAGMVRDREAQKLATNHGLRCDSHMSAILLVLRAWHSRVYELTST
jgi:hypothetical protein